MGSHTRWFDTEHPDGTTVATVMDDISVVVDAANLITIDGPIGSSTTFDFNDAVALIEALREAIEILRDRGQSERDDVRTWLADHVDQDRDGIGASQDRRRIGQVTERTPTHAAEHRDPS